MSAPLYTIGDATAPAGDGVRIIAHVCNDIGKWGAGFVLALDRISPKPKANYLRWYRGEIEDGAPFELGNVQIVRVESGLLVANIIGQHGIARRSGDAGIPPIRYDALDRGLMKLGDFALHENATVHCPRLGAGLAGGHWHEIERILQKTLSSRGVPVTVYDRSEREAARFTVPPHIQPLRSRTVR